MVRLNLVEPKKLADQHLIAEYNEILMLVAYIKSKPSVDNIPKQYCLGKGHMRFFKDKVLYISKRHELLKKEMRKRGFATNITIDLNDFQDFNKADWKPKADDFEIIKERIISKLKLKPDYYRYFGKYKPSEFFIELLE